MAAFAADLGVEANIPEGFEPDHDEHPTITWRNMPGRTNPVARIANAILKGLGELAQLDEPSEFRKMAGLATSLAFARVVVLPLLALHDFQRSGSPKKSWHAGEAFRLLTDDAVVALPSLWDARRLLRRDLLRRMRPENQRNLLLARRPTLDSRRQRAVEASSPISTRSGGLTDEREAASRSRFRTSNELEDPSDPRDESVLMEGHWSDAAEPEAEHGWPVPDDDEEVRYLLTLRADSLREVGSPDRMSALNRQLSALRTISTREHAKSERWLPTVLGWCSAAIEELRRSTEKKNDGKSAPRFDSALWLDTLETETPWWMDWSEIALQFLLGPIPSRHANADAERGTLVYYADDYLRHSLDMLDEILSIDPSACIRSRLRETFRCGHLLQVARLACVYPSHRLCTVFGLGSGQETQNFKGCSTTR